MPELSVVIITLNEERNIGRCLESVKDIADDIIVVDALSDDKTKEICSKFNVNFISRKWTDYSDAKNFANQQAKHDWLLSIDADEALSEKLKKSILSAKSLQEAGFYKFNRLTNYCGKRIKHSGWYPDTKLRIFDRTKARWTGQIHETLEIKSEERSAMSEEGDIKIKFLKGDLLHYSYYKISEHIERINTFTDIAAKELFDKGIKACWCKSLIKTKIKFLSVYFWKLGFLDGYYGLVIAILSAMSEFIKYSKLKSMYKNN